ncbi:hypothetical protein LINPERPRIM_LOCUS19487 [Linum perenne]
MLSLCSSWKIHGPHRATWCYIGCKSLMSDVSVFPITPTKIWRK